jgi:tRNA(Ile)-lysidine synthetase-like protein
VAEPRRLKELAARIEQVADLPEGPLVVALSGGADSACLLWFCRRLRLPVRAVHVHHGLPASDRLAEAAEAIAERLGTPLTVRRVVVPEGPSPENQARIARYAALEEEAEPGEWVLTAHTADDQAETVVLHLLRSSGIDGLKGIPARRPPFARPFLAVTRSETREAASLAGLPWMDDPVNESLDPLRNRIRRRLLPMLEDYNRRIRQSLATTARLVAADVVYLDEASVAPIETTDEAVAIAASLLATAPPSIASRRARRFLAVAGLEAASPDAVAGTLAVARGEIRRHQPGARLTVEREGALVVARKGPLTVPDPVGLEPGVTSFGEWEFDVFVSDDPPTAMPAGDAWMVGDADALDEVAVESASEHPSVADFLADAGVVAAERPAYPVVVSKGEPVWLPMVRRLPVGWVDHTTRRYLVVYSRIRRTWQT